MKEEIDSASQFLGKLLKMGCSDVTRKQIETFIIKMEHTLHEHFQDHWFPTKPFRGSGYRCLRINHKMDPIIAKAAGACGLKYSELQSIFPNELTMWIDPKEVSYRIGENGSICVLFNGDDSSSSSGSDSGDDTSPVQVTPNPKNDHKATTAHRHHNTHHHHHHQAMHPGSGGPNRAHKFAHNYPHPFPTPPSSPPTNHQGNNLQQQHQNRYNSPLLNSSCRKDLNSFWNSSAMSPTFVDGRAHSGAIIGYEHMFAAS